MTPAPLQPTASPPAASRAISGLLSRWVRRGGAEGGALVSRVLSARGLDPGEPATEEFLNPLLKSLHDPSMLPGLDRAAERLVQAARSGESIVIYGDYDVDGISATAILYHTLKALNPEARVGSYVPHRLEEGYGLNAEALIELARGGARVIVTVDCGISAIGPAKALREEAPGTDLIITDHHSFAHDHSLPEAFALVHARLPGSAYPFQELCGAAVAYKLAWRCCTFATGSEKVGPGLRQLLVDLLGLAALGVIADVVPLLDEHRVICRFGLGRIRGSPFEGLRALVQASGLDRERVQAEDVGFKLGPRLNACGRLGHAREAVELLTTATGERCREIATMLTRTNERRRAVERRILDEAVEMAEARGMTRDDRRAIVLAGEDWHPGVVGIVCSRLVERYHRPTLLLGRHADALQGSGRSIPGFHLAEAIAACREGLTSHGGHAMAAGLRLPPDKLDAFTEAFTAHANARLTPNDLIRTVLYDTDARVEELSVPAVRSLEKLAPFGQGNPSVRLRLPGVRISTRPTLLGDTGRHAAFHVTSGVGSMRIVGWNWGDRGEHLKPGLTCDLLVAPKLSAFSGQWRVEGELIDLAPRAV